MVVAAELHVTAIFLVQHVEVVALHDHVVEFQEAQSLCHTLFIALCTQHVVNGKACADLSEQLYIIQLQKPIRIIDHQCFSIGKIDKTAHLLLEAITVMLDRFRGQHLAQITSAGRITDHAGTAAD